MRRPRTDRWIALIVLTAIALYLCWLMIQPMVGIILWATVLAIVSYPYYLQWRKRGWGESAAALVTTAVVVLIVIIPLALLAVALVRQAVPAADALRDAAQRLLSGDSPWRTRIERYVDLGQWQDPQYVADQLKSVIAVVTARTLGILGGLLGAVVQMCLVLFALYFMLRDAERITPAIRDLMPLDREQADDVFRRTHEVISASVRGVLLVAAVQAVLAGVAFAVLGIRGWIIWAALTFLASLIPVVGTVIVWLPMSIYLFITGNWIKGTLLMVWGAGAISMMDNILRPRLVGRRARMHELVVFFSVLGGIQVFGVLGLIVGPVVVALTLMLIEVMRRANLPRRA